uniref:Uncharacterized protein n=1 Tax=Phytophthora ramorum TaxID=164328 RepID=H3GI96_PHYRM
MANDAYYRQALAQMQSEYSRAVTALEKQVAALSQHNELLAMELRQNKQQQSQCALQTQHKLKTQQQMAADREQALGHEVAALKGLLQQEQDYWARYDRASKDDRDRLTKQLAEAKAEAMKHHETSRTLRREMKALQNRVETAVATSNSFEQRLLVVVQEKQQSVQEVETQLAHYKQKLHGKRAQNKYLTEALVRLQEQRQSGDSISNSSPTTTVSSRSARGMSTSTVQPSSVTSMEVVSKPMEVPAQTQQSRIRKRELTLPEEIKGAAANVPSSRMYKSKRLGSSRAGTSPTSSSPEISPRSARSAPYKRPPSVATTAPTTSDGNSFNSNGSSSGSLRSLRSLRNVTGRRVSSRENSDSDHIDVSPGTSAGRIRGANPTGRLERELSGLRRKLDSCMADAAARW